MVELIVGLARLKDLVHICHGGTQPVDLPMSARPLPCIHSKYLHKTQLGCVCARREGQSIALAFTGYLAEVFERLGCRDRHYQVISPTGTVLSFAFQFRSGSRRVSYRAKIPLPLMLLGR